MATSRILTLCDQLVTEINTAWSKGASDTVSRRYVAPVNIHELNALTGRHVFIFPLRYSNAPDTRGKVRYRHEIGIAVVERYEPGAVDPADTTMRTWLDTRVDFCETTIQDTVDYDGADVLAFSSRNVLTESFEVSVYDADLLNQCKLFFCEITAVFLDYSV